MYLSDLARFFDEKDSNKIGHMVEAFIHTGYIDTCYPMAQRWAGPICLPLSHRNCEGVSVPLTPLYLRSLYARMDECVANIVRSFWVDYVNPRWLVFPSILVGAIIFRGSETNGVPPGFVMEEMMCHVDSRMIKPSNTYNLRACRRLNAKNTAKRPWQRSSTKKRPSTIGYTPRSITKPQLFREQSEGINLLPQVASPPKAQTLLLWLTPYSFIYWSQRRVSRSGTL